MKNLTYRVWLIAVLIVSITSCSKDSIEEIDSADLTTIIDPVDYSSMEMDIFDLVNQYRVEKGLSELDFVDEGSIQAEKHNAHMISNDEVCHDDFALRYEALVNSVEAKAVSENVAYGYNSAEAVVNAWIKSDSHRKNIEGNHTHFGISVKQDSEGKFYFTNIFVRK